jgi:hypothetical protein
MRSEKYLRVSETSAPLRVLSDKLWISSQITTETRESTATPQTASTMSVMFARAVIGMPRKRANSAATMRAVAAGGTVM